MQTLHSCYHTMTTELSCSPARGKKKLLKSLLPILIAVKLKAAALLALAFLVISLVAKKAILVSLVSTAISAFVAVQKFLSQRSQHPHHQLHETYVAPYGGGWDGVVGGGYSSGGYGHPEFGIHSSPVAHSLAYGTQKAARK